MKAVSLDPGKTTGICFASVQVDGVNHAEFLCLTVEQAELRLAQMYNMLSNFCEGTDELHIIYEDFSYRNASRMGLDLTPVKLIGIIEMFREWHEPKIGFWKQSAATGKSFYSDDRLKTLGIYEKGKPHGRDATRHMMQWFTFGAGAQFIDIDRIPLMMVPR